MSRKPRSVYVCQACGGQAARWFGRCPSCGEWNTCVEEQIRPAEARRRGAADGSLPRLERVSDLSTSSPERLPTRIAEFDRSLGGGIMPGSAVLIGGDPGIGKSTLLLQVAGEIAAQGLSVAYVSGEESNAQIVQRAGRVGVVCPDLLVMTETDLPTILAELERVRPAMIIVDSVQTVSVPEFESAPGSVTQVRECGARLVQLAKQSGIPVFLVGHVTKEGSIAGPRVLEHLVDTVLYLEGDRHHQFRVLRAVKNRFGSTREIGLFEMRDGGLIEVSHPSRLLLSHRAADVPGSAIVCSMEGTRPLLVEIQALTARATYGYPQRVATGIDAKRLSIILAVLERRGGYELSTDDVFVNVVGGIRLDEPAVDLGVALAVLSSFVDRPLRSAMVAIGEIGLGGEVRPVGQVEQRVREARNLGFERCLLASGNLKGWRHPRGMEVVGVGGLEAARELALESG